MTFWFQRGCLLLLVLSMGLPSLRAQVLIKEVVSREVSVHVGGVQAPEKDGVVSREFSLHVENGTEKQVISREVSLARGSAAAPPAITELTIQVSPTGDSATLNWSGYNQWAVGDISHFVVYLSDTGGFTDVTGMTPHVIVPGESTSITLTGLTAWTDHFFAVVAVDVLGNFIPTVTYSAAYVLSPEAISREVSLFVGAEPDPPYKQVVSREVSLVMGSPAAPPAITDLGVTLSPTGDSATLNWSSYNQWAVGDVVRFDIYLSDTGPITDVTGMTAFSSVGAEQNSVVLNGLTAWTDHYFAVVAVDALGNRITAVNYSAGYVISPEVVSREVSIFVGQEASPLSEVVATGANLGFEAPTIATAIGWTTMSVAQKEAFVWLGSVDGSGGPSLFKNGSAWNFPAVPEGTQGLSLQMKATVSQTFSFPSAGLYRLRWFACARPGWGGINPYLIKLDDQSITPQLAPSEYVWRRNSIDFTVSNAGDHIISFVGLNPAGGDNSVGIDAVSLERVLPLEARPHREQVELVSREVSVVVPDAAVPAPVTGVGSGFYAQTSTTHFGAVLLDWSTYNETIQNDIVRYRVYVSDAFFGSVTGMEPFAFLPAGNQRQTLTGLSGLAIYHIAVVAEDALGGFDPVVRSYSAQASVSGVGEVQALAATSEADALHYTWQPPQGTAGFLSGYRIYFGGSTTAVNLPSSATSWSATGLERARGYPLRITTVNLFGGESAGTSVFASTWLNNPANAALTALGDEILMTWDAAVPSSQVRYYAIYRNPTAFTSVAGMTPVFTRTGTSVVLGGFTEVTDQYFAVVAVNAQEAFDPAVLSVRATKQAQTISFPALTAGTGDIPLVATASSGLPVSFLSSSSLIARVEGSLLRVQQGGSVTVTARQAGDEAYWPASAAQTLRIPPVIASFTANGAELAAGAVLRQPATALAVTARDANGMARADFFGRVPGAADWTLLGADTVTGNGLTATLPVETLPQGPYELRVLVTAVGGFASERVLTVNLDLQPVLTLTLGSQLQEGGTLAGSVSIQRARNTDLQVTIASSQSTQLDPGPPVVIPAGQTSAVVTVSGRQDQVIEAPMNIRVTASAPGVVTVEKTVSLLDDDWPVLTLTLDRNTVSEADGADAIQARIERDMVSPLPLTVWLVNTNSAAVTVPASVVIPGGSGAVEFPVGVVDNNIVDGSRTAKLKGEIRVSGAGVIVETAETTINVGDDEGPSLELSFASEYLPEGQTGTVRVKRLRGNLSTALSVRLTSSLPTELQVPTTVSIPAGADEATFNATALDDGVADGNKNVRVTATATGYSAAQAFQIVTDLGRADLIVGSVTSAASVDTEATFAVSYQVQNRGTAAASGSFVQRVFLSKDRVVGNDILLTQSTFSGGLAAGSSFTRTDQVRAPREAGTYWPLIITDAAGAVEEIIESNNTVFAAQPIVVGEAYTATVQTATTIVPANTSIPFTGSAVKAGGAKVPNEHPHHAG